MSEREFGFKIKQQLDRALDLDAATLSQLKNAREQALKHQRTRQPALELAWASTVVGRLTGSPASAGAVLAGAALVLALFGLQYWHRAPTAEEIEEIDAAILTGDLPINAYLDNSFETWLKRSQH